MSLRTRRLALRRLYLHNLWASELGEFPQDCRVPWPARLWSASAAIIVRLRVESTFAVQEPGWYPVA